MRSFTTPSNYLEVNHTFALAPVGCVVFYFRPNWTGYTFGSQFNLFEFSNPAGDKLHFFKTAPLDSGNEYIWAGIIPGTPPAVNVDWRVLINSVFGPPFSSQPMFREVEDAWWQYTWDAPNGCTWLFKNGACVGGMNNGRPGYHVPFTAPTFTNLKIGRDNPGNGANGDIGEFALFDYHLSDVQRENMRQTGIAGISPPPQFWAKILGNENPEPAEIGPDLTVIGTPPQAAFPHPVFRDVPAQITAAMKPSTAAQIHPTQPLADGLIWAMPLNEGAGLPREHVSGVLPTLNTSTPGGFPAFVWEGDGSLHFNPAYVDAMRWDGTTVFDGLRSFTVCFNMKIDLFVSASGSQFAFPNLNAPMMFGKQYCMGYSQGEASQSVFAFTLNHDDETENANHHTALSGAYPQPGDHLGKRQGGRWGFWSWTGRGTGPPQSGGSFPSLEGIDTWYSWRTSWLPWDTQFRQMFLVYDTDAPVGSRWTLRINGKKEYAGDIMLDNPQPLETTSAPVVFGATNVAPFPLGGQMLGSFQYIYVWNTAKPDAWQTLLDDPYALFRPATIQSVNGVMLRDTKVITNVAVGLVQAWGIAA